MHEYKDKNKIIIKIIIGDNGLWWQEMNKKRKKKEKRKEKKKLGT